MDLETQIPIHYLSGWAHQCLMGHTLCKASTLRILFDRCRMWLTLCNDSETMELLNGHRLILMKYKNDLKETQSP